MKKILLLIASIAVLSAAVSCSDNDEPKRGDGVFTVNTTMINHMVNTITGEAIDLATTHNKLVLDTVKHTASVELSYNDGTDHTVSIKGITATPKRLGFYELTAAATSEVQDFKGYVDFNEGAIRYRYTTSSGIRVISTIPDVFFLKTKNTITYDDTTQTTQMENTMYQFSIQPASKTATVKVMGIVHAKDLKYFNNITASSVPVTVTPNGYSINSENLKTIATYRNYVDSTGSVISTTDKYPFKMFNATIDLVNDSLDANYMIGGSATVTATGRTYPDYSAY